MIHISRNVEIPEHELEMQAIRAQGAGGQNVNKVSTAIHLRFDVRASSLPDFYKERLLAMADTRISKDGIINIKSQEYNSQVMNREAAIERLINLVRRAAKPEKKRRPTKPGKAAKQKRLDEKAHRGKTKALRGKVEY